MIDVKRRLSDLVRENASLRERLELAQRELAESVREEIELKVALRKLSDKVESLRAQIHEAPTKAGSDPQSSQ